MNREEWIAAACKLLEPLSEKDCCPETVLEILAYLKTLTIEDREALRQQLIEMGVLP